MGCGMGDRKRMNENRCKGKFRSMLSNQAVSDRKVWLEMGVGGQSM